MTCAGSALNFVPCASCSTSYLLHAVAEVPRLQLQTDAAGHALSEKQTLTASTSSTATAKTANVIGELGEERLSCRIAKAIVRPARRNNNETATVISRLRPHRSCIHPRRAFRPRIAVNDGACGAATALEHEMCLASVATGRDLVPSPKTARQAVLPARIAELHLPAGTAILYLRHGHAWC
jgi:hypothetical protein